MLIYGDLPIPEIKEDEILVKVASGSFNPCERQVGAGEYVATKGAWAAPAPSNYPLNRAGAIPLAALTAWEAVFTHGKLENGQTIIINGASGGVGSYAVQLAKWKCCKCKENAGLSWRPRRERRNDGWCGFAI